MLKGKAATSIRKNGKLAGLSKKVAAVYLSR